MLIYNVSPIKGMAFLFYISFKPSITCISVAVSQAGKRDELLSKIPSKEGNEQVQWVWTGMLIELDQYVTPGPQNLPLHLWSIIRCVLRSDIRALGHRPSSEDKLKIQDKRESLRSRIEAFHQQGLRFIRPDATLPTSSSLTKHSKTSTIDLEESDEETFFLDANSEWEEEEGAHELIEQVMIWLPSSFTKSERIQMGLEQIAKVEAELREGQANDALEALRASLAEKSLRFRTEVKPAKSQRTMTRAWDSIHKADKQIRGAVQCYRLARTALGGLGVAGELLERYKEIHKRDLKMSGDVVEENRVGQRSWELPWFWRLDRKWDKEEDEFLKECKLLWSFF